MRTAPGRGSLATLAASSICSLALAPVTLPAAPVAASQGPCIEAAAGIDALVASLAGGSGPDAPRNTVVRVSSPRLGFEHAAAAGRARADAREPMTVQRPFYIASITKPMVAARILQLVEAGKLSLDTTLAEAAILPGDALERLQVYQGRSYGASITLRQLLQHRSGLRDMLLDDRDHLGSEFESGTAPGSLGGIWSSQLERYLECRREQAACTETERSSLYPGHRWKPFDAAAWQSNHEDRDAGLMNFFLAEMDGSGLFAPGTAFHYADTNYILLGMLLEKLSGRSLHAELRDFVFEPLGMAHTYLSYAPDPDARPRDLAPADFWVGDVPIISSELDISFDWSGGGVVTTAADLERFLRGIDSAALFRQRSTRDAMLDCVPMPSHEGRTGGYGLGVRCLDTPYGPTWGHHGAWGAVMLLFPRHDVSVTGSVGRLFDGPAMEKLTFGSMEALKAAGVIP